ncbi:hypothetical protein N7532_004925 [Penicillium argentinense]|uniref:FAD synthase n=1 Tax=Penicillium argentinense TaxID=1131581 RepID=A0A9W9FD80_9EURO|nr:uncharacterized protein N7532_004925 [Penicillium argentinense]KAJ5097924.1 hypothetical protein N7532_004925 [Penicillium argentinense]
MAQSSVPDERPAELPADSHRPSRAQDHLRPFPPAAATPIAHRGPGTTPDQNGSTNGHASKTTGDTGENYEEIPPLPEVIARIHTRVQAFLAETHPPDSLLASVQQQTRTSLEVVASALTRYKLSELSLSYNGGKDCLVLLVLFLAGLHPYSSHVQDHTTQPSQSGGTVSKEKLSNPVIPSIYALPPDPFPAVEDFVITSAQAYHLAITKYTTEPPRTTLRSSFEDYLSRHPGIRAIFVGTRRTDPHGARLTHFDRTDSGWPDFMRIHPVIDWHYAEIWAFIRHLGLEYCSLYDMGYTSLGGTSDTHPNPRLQVERSGSDGQYLPAYELTEDLEERLGRK